MYLLFCGCQSYYFLLKIFQGLLKMTLVDEGYEPEKVIGMATVSKERHYTIRMKGISAVDYLPVALMERDYPKVK